METIKNWAFSVCCASVFCGILNLILPEGSAQKIFKAVIYVFFLSVVVSTFSGLDFSEFWDSYDKNTEKILLEENAFNEISEDFIKNELLSATNEILVSEGIKSKEILFEVNISADGSIDIIDFTITFSEPPNTEDLSEKIYQKTGIEPEIIISGEN